MGIGNYSRLLEYISQQKICYLSAYTGKGKKGIHVIGNDTAEFVY